MKWFVLFLFVFTSCLLNAQDSSITMTHGPVVEGVTPTTAIIAWSTSVSSGTMVRFGTDATRMDSGVGMPWGGYTHRVTLQNLRPDTTYYFQAESPDAQGSGGDLKSPLLQFHTPAR